jgi:Ca2+-binding EF-hand superfamily protein
MFSSLRDTQRRELSKLFRDVDVNSDGVISSQ